MEKTKRSYMDVFGGLSPNQKSVFLEKILRNSLELQIQLRNYFDSEVEAKTFEEYDFDKNVKVLRKEYVDQLESIDLEDPDYERDHNYHGRHYDHWEIDQMLIDDEVTEMFDGFADEMLRDIANGDLEVALAQIVALLEACHIAQLDDPNYNLNGDPNASFLDHYEIILQDIQYAIQKIVFNEDVVTFSLIKAIRYIATQHEQDKFTSIDTLIESILQENPYSCIAVYQLFCELEKNRLFLPISYMETLKVANIDSWLIQAEERCVDNLNISTRLLQYLAKQDKQKFHIEAKRLFPIFPNELLDLIAIYVDSAIDSEFAKHVWLFKTKRCRKIEDYRHLATLLNQSERFAFIESFRKAYPYDFYVKMLEAEGLFSQILDFVGSSSNSLNQYAELMSPIILKFPADCFRIVESKIKEYLQVNVSRNSYATVASLLLFLKTDERNIGNVRSLVDELNALYPRRSTMRNEFSQLNL